jgi:hypothetical protein
MTTQSCTTFHPPMIAHPYPLDLTWFHLRLPVTGSGIAQNYVPLTE